MITRRQLTIILTSVALCAQARAWDPVPAFPDPAQGRAYGAGVYFGGDIYVIGGTPFGTSGDKDTPVHILTAGASAWVDGIYAEQSILRQGAGVDDLGRIIVFGGVHIVPGEDPGQSYVYDPNEGQYQAIAERGSAAPPDYFAWTTDDQGRVYSLGGGPGASASVSQPNSTYAERYIGSTDTWQPIAALPIALADASAVFDERGHVLVFGGIDATASSRLATTLQYDIATDTWSSVAVAPMPAALSGHRAILGSNERVYVLGGEQGPIGSGTTSDACYILNLDTGAWTTGPSMSTPRHHLAVVRDANDFIYALGGDNDAGGTHLCEKLYTPPCPVITDPPDSLASWVGATAAFAVAADGGLPMTYQWRKGGIDLVDGPTGSGSTISGATTPSLAITSVNPTDAGAYDVVISNDCGDTYSNIADLVVNIPPDIPSNWEATSIHPAWAQTSSIARGIGNGRIGGEAATPTLLPDGRTLDLAHPVVWDANAPVGIDITPGGSVGGGINDVEGDLLVGWFWHTYSCPSGGQTWTCAWQSAAFWTAPTLTFAEAIHSSGPEYDQIYGTDGEHMAGVLVYETQLGLYDSKAYMWTSNNQGHSLHFAEASDTSALAGDGDFQYGWYRIGTGSTRACRWETTSDSHVDMNPPGHTSSYISAASDGLLTGTADNLAGMWSTTAESFVSLHPAGAGASGAVATKQGIQAGHVDYSAALWASSASTYFDLGAFAPEGFTSSYAEDLEIAPDGSFTVVGYGYNALVGRTEALIWRSRARFGDCDLDSDVDFIDFQGFIGCFAGPHVDPGAACDCYDADDDLDTDLLDFTEFQRQFTGG